MLTVYVSIWLCIYVNVCQKLYVPNDLCTQLFADANVRIQLYMPVYSCVNMLIKAVTSCSTHKIDQQETDG